MAKKLPSTFINMVLVLTTISLISAFALGYTYSKTIDRINANADAKKKKAIEKVLPAFNNDINSEMYTADGIADVELYPASLNGVPVGTAIKTWSDQGFSGRIWLMVGLDTNAAVVDIRVLKHKETPGLGSKMSEDSFLKQFCSLVIPGGGVKVKNDGGSIDALTAATISSRAFCDAVNRAVNAYEAGRNEL